MMIKRGYEAIIQANPALESLLPERSAKRARLEQAENQAFVQSVSSIHIDEDKVEKRRDDEHNATETRPITPPLSDVGSDMVSPLLDNKRMRASDFVPVATANSTPLETLTPTSSDFAMTTPSKPQQCEPPSQALVFKTPAPVSAPSTAPAAAPVPTFQTPAPKAKAACASDRTPTGSQLASRTPAPVSTGKKARPPIPDPVNPWRAPADRWAAAMACVFRYVDTPAMLQVARVARSWRAASQAPCSWETVDVHTAWRKVTVECVRGIIAVRGTIITSFVLDQCFGIKDEVLALIAQDCPNLTRLSLVGCWDVTDQGIKHVAERLPHLKHINLSSCRKLTDLAVVALANHCIELQTIQLEYCKNLTDTSLAYILARCRLLRTLNLKRCTGISNNAFVEFRKHPAYSLRHLVLSDCFGLSDDGVAHIAAGCPNLEAINLSFCSRITEAALEQLAQHCPHLAHVDLSSCASAATNRAVNILLGGPPLDHDSHSDVVMYPEAGGLRATLRHISLRACPNVTDIAVQMLNDLCTSLRFLDVMNCQSVSADVIARCTRIKVIVAGSTMGLTPAKRPRLEEAPSTLKKHTSSRA